MIACVHFVGVLAMEQMLSFVCAESIGHHPVEQRLSAQLNGKGFL